MKGAGGGEFDARYPWYVQSVRKRISDNWLQTPSIPQVRAARKAHTIVTFTIIRDGTIKNISSTLPGVIVPWTTPPCAPCSASTKCPSFPPTGAATPSTSPSISTSASPLALATSPCSSAVLRSLCVNPSLLSFLYSRALSRSDPLCPP